MVIEICLLINVSNIVRWYWHYCHIWIWEMIDSLQLFGYFKKFSMDFMVWSNCCSPRILKIFYLFRNTLVVVFLFIKLAQFSRGVVFVLNGKWDNCGNTAGKLHSSTIESFVWHWYNATVNSIGNSSLIFYLVSITIQRSGSLDTSFDLSRWTWMALNQLFFNLQGKSRHIYWTLFITPTFLQTIYISFRLRF